MKFFRLFSLLALTLASVSMVMPSTALAISDVIGPDDSQAPQNSSKPDNNQNQADDQTTKVALLREQVEAHTKRIDILREQAQKLGESVVAGHRQLEKRPGYDGLGLIGSVVRLANTLSEVHDEIKKHQDARSKLEAQIEAILNPKAVDDAAKTSNETARTNSTTPRIDRSVLLEQEQQTLARKNKIRRMRTEEKIERLVKAIAKLDLDPQNSEGRNSRVELSKLREQQLTLQQSLQRDRTKELKLTTSKEIEKTKADISRTELELIENQRAQDTLLGVFIKPTGPDQEPLLTPFELEAESLAKMTGTPQSLGRRMATLLTKEPSASVIREMLVTLLALEWISEEQPNRFVAGYRNLSSNRGFSATLHGVGALVLASAVLDAMSLRLPESRLLLLPLTSGVVLLETTVLKNLALRAGRPKVERAFLNEIANELGSRKISGWNSKSKLESLTQHIEALSTRIGQADCEIELTSIDPQAAESNSDQNLRPKGNRAK